MVLVVSVVLTACPVGHKNKKAAVEAAGPTSSGRRQGRRADRPGADRSDVKSALVTSRAGCATAGAAATAGILAVRDGSPGQSSSLLYRNPVAVGVRAGTGATVCNQKRETLVFRRRYM